MVPCGFTQQHDVDYHDTFSPVVIIAIVWIILSVIVSRDWHLRKIDVSNAFLYGFLNEDVYMTQPPGFEDSHQPYYVCKLHKDIYGLKQYRHISFSRLTDKLH